MMISRDECIRLMGEMTVIADNLILNRLDVCMENLVKTASVLVDNITGYFYSPQVDVEEEYRIKALTAVKDFVEAFNAGDMVGLADSMKYELREILEYMVKSE